MRGIVELVLEVTDLERSERFYGEAIGLPVVERWPPPRAAVWLLLGPHTRLGLWLPETGGSRGLYGSRGGDHVHFAVGVTTDELRALAQRLAERGVQVNGPVRFTGGDQSIYVTDPDGHVLEFWDVEIARLYAPAGRPGG